MYHVFMEVHEKKKMDPIDLLNKAVHEVYKVLAKNENVAFVEENSENLNELISTIKSKLEFWNEYKTRTFVNFSFCFSFLGRNSKGPHYCFYHGLFLDDEFEECLDSMIELLNTDIKKYTNSDKFDSLVVSIGTYKGNSLVDFLYYDIFYVKGFVSLI